MREIITFDQTTGRHAKFVADAEGEPVVMVHQHIRHDALDTGSPGKSGSTWYAPTVEVKGGRMGVSRAVDLFAALAHGMEKAMSWQEDTGKPVEVPE